MHEVKACLHCKKIAKEDSDFCYRHGNFAPETFVSKGITTVASIPELHDLPLKELASMEEILLEESDPIKRRLKFDWVNNAEFARHTSQRYPAESNEVLITLVYSQTTQKNILRALPLDKDILHFLKTYGDIYDGRTWEEYQSGHLLPF